MLPDKLRAHWRPLALLATALLLLPMANSVVGGTEQVFVAANAPQEGQALHVTVSKDPNLFGSCSSKAEVEILRDGIIVFPGVHGEVEMDGCRGTIDIPYNRFAGANDRYLVRATYDGQTAETRVAVFKVVQWVYVRAFPDPENERTRIEAAFDRVKGQPLTSSIFSSGTLELNIRWERCSNKGPLGLPAVPSTEECRANGQSVFYAEIPVESRASTNVILPWDALDEDSDDEEPPEGWYNVTAVFHNDEAKGNYNVPQDPSTYQEDPPGNWFEVSYD